MAKALPSPARGTRRTAPVAETAPEAQADTPAEQATQQTQQWGGHNPSTDQLTQLLLTVLTRANQQIPTPTGLIGPALDVALRFQTLSAQLSTLADPAGLRNLP
ncbi:hypothetical protein [Rhizobacter sp. P5_C2]